MLGDLTSDGISSQNAIDQRRDELLLRLLKTPPQPLGRVAADDDVAGAVGGRVGVREQHLGARRARHSFGGASSAPASLAACARGP